MLQHFWTTAIRNLSRYKLFTSINVIGLSLAIAIFLALTGYVKYQFSFDKFYESGDRVYRIDYYEYQQGLPVLQTARTHSRTALLVHEYVPQAEAVARVYHEKAFIFTEDVRIVDQDMMFVDSSFFQVFDVKILSGSSDKSLIAPHTVMISKSQANAYFGNEDPLGKSIYFNERLHLTITGVFEDIPKTSSMDFDFLISWSTIVFNGWGSKDGSFDNPGNFTFIKLREAAEDINAVNNALSRMAKDHITSLEKRGHMGRYSLRPYEEIHFANNLSGELKPGINKTLLYALISLAVFILIAGWINYVNLSLARAIERAEEIGIRRVFGASRLIISGQFLLEAFILAFFTFLGGYGLFLLFTGPLSFVFFTHVTFLNPDFKTWSLYLFAFVTATTLIAFYPAHFISRYKPALIIKQKFAGKSGAGFLRQGLVVFQLFLAISILGITLVAGRQVKFMRDFDAGFNSRQTIALRGPASTNSDSLRYTRYTAFRSEVLRHPTFSSGTSSFNIPGEEMRFHDEGVHAVGSSNEKKQSFSILWTDEGYQGTFGMKLAGGRNFNEKESGNTCMINETAALALGYQNPMDAVNTSLITSDQKTYIIVGVWKDYHHESIHKPVMPVIFFHRHPFEYGYYSFQLQSAQGNFLETLQQVWEKHYPDDQFIYYFMDSFFEQQYRADELFGKLMGLFSGVAMIVAALGLFGMASLSIVKRVKEIGIRKVLGATVRNILLLISKDYVKLVLISSLFAFPITYYITTRWLQGFAYKINMSWWLVVLPGLIVLAATLLTIAGQAIRAALSNPAKTLRDQ